MFSVQQKRDIANTVQKILRDTGHPELPVGEIQFKLYVHGRYQWSWADIQNNGAVPVPSVNPWNETQDKGTPAEDRYGREPDKVKSNETDKLKYDLAIIHEHTNLADSNDKQTFIDANKMIRNRTEKYANLEITAGPIYEGPKVKSLAQYLFEHDCEYADIRSSREYFQQALTAYESTQGVQIRIERV